MEEATTYEQLCKNFTPQQIEKVEWLYASKVDSGNSPLEKTSNIHMDELERKLQEQELLEGGIEEVEFYREEAVGVTDIKSKKVGKKMKKSLVLFSAIVALGAATVPTIVSADQINEQTQKQSQLIEQKTKEQKKQSAIQEFTDMQDKITNSMSVENGRYVYNESTIKNIIDLFDFTSLKENTGIDYTNSSFFDIAIENIRQTRLTDINDRGGNKYNENKVEEGWNYGRFWWDEANTNAKIDQLEDIADMISGGTIAGSAIVDSMLALMGAAIASVFASLLAAGFGLEAWLLNNIAENLGKVQNGTGTVLEINRFTAVYDCWSQDQYPG